MGFKDKVKSLFSKENLPEGAGLHKSKFQKLLDETVDKVVDGVKDGVDSAKVTAELTTNSFNLGYGFGYKDGLLTAGGILILIGTGAFLNNVFKKPGSSSSSKTKYSVKTTL